MHWVDGWQGYKGWHQFGNLISVENPQWLEPFGITPEMIDPATGQASVIQPPTPNQGARRVWTDSRSRVWVSEWNSGNLSRYDPTSGAWQTWKLPGARPRAYSVFVDDRDIVWVSDFAANAIVRFDPATETFTAFPSDRENANVRQMLGRPGEVWGAESGTDRLVVIRTR